MAWSVSIRAVACAGGALLMTSTAIAVAGPTAADAVSRPHCPSAEFGAAVAISGNTAIIGAPFAPGGGAVCIYGRSGGPWRLQAVFRDPPHGKYDDFGTTVATSSTATASYVMVGALGDADNNGTTQPDGPVYVYEHTGRSWRPMQTIKDPLGYHPGNWFGATMAMSGSSAVLTAIGTKNFKGAAYIYTFGSRQWRLQGVLPHPHATDFGGLAAMSGATVVIGDGARSSPPGSLVAHAGVGRCRPPPSSRHPDAWVFTRSGSKWHLQAHIAAYSFEISEPAVAISGNIVMIAGIFFTCGGTGKYSDQGKVFVFRRSGNKWHWVYTIPDPGHSHGDFGTGLGISGSRAVIGAPFARNTCGVAYAYHQVGRKWTVRTDLVPPRAGKCGKIEGFGWAISLSGTTAIIGAPGNGKTYVFNVP